VNFDGRSNWRNLDINGRSLLEWISKETGYANVWIHLAEDNLERRDLIKTEINIWVQKIKAANFLPRRMITCFSRRALLRGVSYEMYAHCCT
jgi:hypothetical protein